ncbi:MAG: hypothetical protein KDC05_15950, partial [Bacteroidales bacterium]|nr:hypothetical protein [Bacteroidales bacterium]
NFAVAPSGGLYAYDFSTGANQAYGGANGHNEIAPGVWGLISGDGDRDGSIGAGDKAADWDNEAGKSGYLTSDYNLDSQSNNIDKDDFWVPNMGKSSQVPD